MIIIGLFLILVPVLIILKVNEFNTKKRTRMVLDIFLVLISIIYLIISLVWKTEPFNFEIREFGDFITCGGVIFVFSPFLWIVLYYFCRKIFKNIRVRKNSKIESNKKWEYYRDDLDKTSPSIVMFTSMMDIDIGKSISATILKLKLMGYIQESNNKLSITSKDDNGLLKTEKVVLKAIKTDYFDKNLYKKLVRDEALNGKYIQKISGGKVWKICKMLIALCIPVVMFYFSVKFDNLVFSDYVYKNNNLIRNLDSLLVFATIISPFVAVFTVIQQIRYFNKSYKRTIKGNELLNKAYALKNYLKDYSLIKDRTEKELILWEYYLIYAVALDVNMKIEDEIMPKTLFKTFVMNIK